MRAAIDISRLPLVYCDCKLAVLAKVLIALVRTCSDSLFLPAPKLLFMFVVSDLRKYADTLLSVAVAGFKFY